MNELTYDPADARQIETWLLRQFGLKDEVEVHTLVEQTLRETGVTMDQLFPEGRPEHS